MHEAADPLYKKALLRLAANADGAGALAGADAWGQAANPACGDTVRMAVALAGGRITALAHATSGCLLTQASAAILGRIGPGMGQSDVAELQAGLKAMLEQGAPPPSPDYAAFDGAAALPGRHACVLLPLKALLAALEQAPPR